MYSKIKKTAAVKVAHLFILLLRIFMYMIIVSLMHPPRGWDLESFPPFLSVSFMGNPDNAAAVHCIDRKLLWCLLKEPLYRWIC